MLEDGDGASGPSFGERMEDGGDSTVKLCEPLPARLRLLLSYTAYGPGTFEALLVESVRSGWAEARSEDDDEDGTVLSVLRLDGRERVTGLLERASASLLGEPARAVAIGSVVLKGDDAEWGELRTEAEPTSSNGLGEARGGQIRMGRPCAVLVDGNSAASRAVMRVNDAVQGSRNFAVPSKLPRPTLPPCTLP